MIEISDCILAAWKEMNWGIFFKHVTLDRHSSIHITDEKIIASGTFQHVIQIK